MPEILEKCVEKLIAKGKSKSSAYAICTASLKKAGKLDEEFITWISDVGEKSFVFTEFERYAELDALGCWSIPTKRESIPNSHFFDEKNKRLPYINSDESINSMGIVAALKLATEASSPWYFSPEIISNINKKRKEISLSASESKDKSSVEKKMGFSSPEINLSEVELGETKSKPIQLLRSGSFKHPWWGILRFDKTFFDKMVSNFKSGIPQMEISFDFRHQPDFGAAAWVKGLTAKEDGLYAEVEFTKRGRQSIKDKEFRYFSSEYTDDYKEYIFYDSIDENGNKKEVEQAISYGPTLLGGGLTNRPFIKGMAPVSLSEDGKTEIPFEEILENKNFSEEVNEEMKKLEELIEEQTKLQDRIKKLEEEKNEKNSKELGDLKVQLETVKADIVKLNVEKKSGEEENRKLQESITEKDKELVKKQKELNDLSETVKKLSTDLSTLSGSVTNLLGKNKQLEDERFKLSAEKTVNTIRSLGAFPATIKVLEKYILHDEMKGFSITLSEKEGEATKEVKRTFSDIAMEILESIPKEYRFSEEETSHSVANPSGDMTTSLSSEDVEKYAADKKINFSDALIELSKQGKI